MSTETGSYPTWPPPEDAVVLDEYRRHWAINEPDGATVFFIGSAPDLFIAFPTARLRDLLANLDL